MEWLAFKVYAEKEYLDEIAEIYSDLGSGGAVIDDPDLIENYAKSGQWDAWEFPEDQQTRSYSVTGYFPINEELDCRIASLISALDALTEKHKDFSYRTEKYNVDEEDWANSWKKYFKVLKIGKRTIIRPSWEEYEKKNDEIVIDLDPGMAFGTGSHATTSLAMELVEKYLGAGSRVIDVGTGSGIISIQAAKLGAGKILAFDYDAVAVEAARNNVSANKLSAKIEVKQNDLLNGVTEKADLIIANIVADVILRLIPQLEGCLAEGGRIILSGIIEKRLDEVLESLNTHGYEVLETRENEGWYALGLKRSDR